MAKLKAEVLYQRYQNRPRPLGHLAAGPDLPPEPDRVRDGPSGQPDAAQPACSNGCSRKPPASTAGARCRRSPASIFAAGFGRHAPAAGAGTRGEVVLLDDCFTTYNEPEVGIAAVRVLEAAGYRVRLAGLECCGRPAISKGLLPLARELARANVQKLLPFARDGTPILGCEPSCLVTLVDEYRDFRLGPDAEEVARALRSWSTRSSQTRAGCRSFRSRLGRAACWCTAIASRRRCSARRERWPRLQRVPGLEINELDSGCCGMAGSFGYELGHFEVSVALANRVLIPAARPDPRARLVAPGFSCRSQVHGLAGLVALHPMQVLSDCL